MTEKIAEDLLELKQKIDQSKTETARIEGQIQQLEKQRTEQYGCATDEEANMYIEELKEETQRLEKELVEDIQTIKDELGWQY